MPDSEAIDRGLEAYLRADTTLAGLAPGGIWFGMAPQQQTAPFVIWELQASEDRRTHDRGGVEQALYLVKGVSLGTAAPAFLIAQRLRTLLEGQSFAATGYEIVRCEREQRIGYVEPDGDRRWIHRGAIWEIFAAPL